MDHQRNRRIRSGNGFFGSFDSPWSERSFGLICDWSNETLSLISDSFGFKIQILDFLKETHLQSRALQYFPSKVFTTVFQRGSNLLRLMMCSPPFPLPSPNSNNWFYYMASSMSGQDEPNHAPWLATRAGKMELSCLLGTTRCILQENFPRKP